MSTFVLVHGGWVGGWYWEKVVPILEAQGHQVLAPDLPGHGRDRTPIGEITLDSYVHRVVEVLEGAGEPVVLVGHSSGGVVITQTAEERPDLIELLVYVCAYLPANGQSLFDVGQNDREGLVLPNLVIAPDGSSAMIREEVVREALFADCSEEDYLRAVARYVPEPVSPAATPVKLTPDNFGRVPRAYLECRSDRAISLELQRQMHGAVPCDPVLAMDSGHSPQYAAPDVLAACLMVLAGGR